MKADNQVGLETSETAGFQELYQFYFSEASMLKSGITDNFADVKNKRRISHYICKTAHNAVEGNAWRRKYGQRSIKDMRRVAKLFRKVGANSPLPGSIGLSW